MGRKTKEEADRTRSKILEVALEVFYEKGFSRATLNDIAQRAGFTRGAVYWHFEDKVDLFTAMVDSIEQGAGVNAESMADYRVDKLSDLRDQLIAYLMLFEYDDRYRMMYELLYMGTESSDELEPVLSQSREALRCMTEGFSRDLKRLKRIGKIRKTVKPQRAALMISAFVTGLIDTWLFDRGVFSMRKDAPEMLDQFLELFTP